MRADLQRIPKLWCFSKFDGFSPELLLLKVRSNLNFFWQSGGVKKKARLQYCTEGRHMNTIWFSHGKFDVVFISGLKMAY